MSDDAGKVVEMKGGGRPFTSETAKAASARAQEVRREKARKNKEEFVGRIAGAKARVSYLPRELVQSLAFATADLMLMKVLTGEVTVSNARDATQVAKLALEIGRLEAGDPSSITGEVTPEERDRLREAAKQLRDELVERAKQAEAEERRSGADPDFAATVESNEGATDSTPSSTEGGARSTLPA